MNAKSIKPKRSASKPQANKRKKADQSFRESEERFRAIASNTPDHILVQDRNLRYLLVINPQLGLTEKDMIGKTDHDILTKKDADAVTKIKKQVIETDAPVHFETPLIDREGKRQFFDGSYVPKHDALGRVDGLIGYFRNVTEQKLAEEALRVSESRLDAVFNGVSETLTLLDIDGNILAANAIAIKRFNQGKPDLVGKNLFDLIPVNFHEPRKKQIAELVRTKKPVKFEDRLGETILDLTFYPIFDDQGNVTQFISFAFDVTARKKAEAALRESEGRYRTLFNSLIEGYCIIEMVFDADNKPVDYRFLEVNEAFESQTGLHDAQGKLMRDLASDHEQYWFDIYGKIALTGEPMHFMNEAKALNRWYDVRAFRLGGQESKKVVICFSDITERKKMEQELQTTLQRFYMILSGMHFGILLVTAENQVEFANQAFCDIFGLADSPSELKKLSADEIIKKIRPSYINPEEAVARIKEIVSLEQPVWGEDVGMRGERTYLRDFIPIRIGEKKYGRLWVHMDITERKKAEQALKESEERFKAIALTTPVGIGVVGLPEAKFLYVNPAYERAFGYKGSELLGQGTPQIYWTIEDREKILALLKENGNVAEYEVKLKRKDGTPFWGLSSVRPITFDGRPALLGTFVDITDRKNAEEQLLQNTVELRRSNEELERFNRAMVGRELRMVELKKQVNELCEKLGEPLRYKTQFEEGNKEP